MVSSQVKGFIGNRTIVLPYIDSTNSFACDLLSKSNPTEGTAVFTYFQTKGKGQIGRSWHSEPNKNLTLSIILKPVFLDVKNQFLLNIFLSLVISKFIEQLTGFQIKIKWPNDIYFQDKKLAGILIQNQIVSKRITHSVLGIGINVNQETFPVDLPNPISLKQISGQTYQLLEIKDQLFPIIEKNYLLLSQHQHTQLLRNEYISRIYLKDVPATFETPDGTVFRGVIRKIMDTGALIMDTGGKEKVFQFNEFQYRI